ILGKPKDKQDAFSMLRQLSAKTHKVMTGVCIMTENRMESFCDVSEVTFYPLTDEEIEKYIATGEPMDKAGAYGIQGQGALLVKHINGDFYSIMGLPIARINQILRTFITG
ncbi:MAG: Maf-like protein, partial [Clostridiaceae bacterium]|nr:Maf-like protein [Clostridiaceae bacterium]